MFSAEFPFGQQVVELAFPDVVELAPQSHHLQSRAVRLCHKKGNQSKRPMASAEHAPKWSSRALMQVRNPTKSTRCFGELSRSAEGSALPRNETPPDSAPSLVVIVVNLICFAFWLPGFTRLPCREAIGSTLMSST